MSVASVSKGTVVRILSERNSWASIEAPEQVPVWISAVFLKNGQSLPDARLRCGPGVTYPEYELKLPEKTPVKILRQTQNGLWFQIAPPPGLFCYANIKYLSECGSKSEKQIPEPQLYMAGDERPVSLEGKLVLLKKTVAEAHYELILEINNEEIPVCYLTAKRLNLKLWEDRMVRIDGMQRWIKGVKRPFVEIEKVSPSWK